MYTPETRLDFGKYKTLQLKYASPHYLMELYRNVDVIKDKPELKEYIETYYPEVLVKKPLPVLSTPKVKLASKIDSRFSGFLCTKRAFPTKKDAMDSIVKPPKRRNGKAPLRAYECPKCSQWHLTSKSVEEYRNSVNKFATGKNRN